MLRGLKTIPEQQRPVPSLLALAQLDQQTLAVGSRFRGLIVRAEPKGGNMRHERSRQF
jgi:hypothetical protein